MIDDLAAFIRARLDEDEAAAKAWERAPWPEPGEVAMHWRPVGKRVVRYDNGRDEHLQAIDVSGRPALYAEAIWLKWDTTGERAVHIARHDPARALREVNVKRERLTAYLAIKSGAERDDSRWQAGGLFALEFCVREDATVWSDHPDYRAEWAL